MITAATASRYSLFNPRLQSRDAVRADLEKRGIKASWTTIGRLRRFSLGQYEDIMGLVDRLQKQGAIINNIEIDRPENLPSFNFYKLPSEITASCVSNLCLDLRGVKEKLLEYHARWQGEDQTKSPFRGDSVEHLLDVIRAEQGIFTRIAKQDDATVTKLFNSLDRGKENFGILNVVVYRPLENGKWVMTTRTTQWNKNSESRYDPKKGGSYPETTLKSAIEGENIISDVNIDDLETFRRAGIMADEASIANDRANSKEGSRRMLFIKLVSTDGKVEAVIQLHNLVAKEERLEPPPLLPEREEDAERVKGVLGLYFDAFVKAVETIRRKRAHEPKEISFPELVVLEATEIEERKEGFKESSPVAAALGAKPFSDTLFSDETQETEYLRLKIEVDRNPYKHIRKIRTAVVEKLIDLAEKCIGGRMSAEEMEKHAIDVDHAEFARDGDRLVAFGTSGYYERYENNDGKQEQLTLLSGTMVDPDYRRMGLMIKLNYDLINEAKIAVRGALRGWFSWIRRIFVPAPMTVRTQSRAVLEACSRHFKGVRRPGLPVAPRYRHMTNFVALKEGWEIDENNIQRNAYTEKRVDREADLIPGLGEHDAYVFSGDFTLWRELLTKFALKVLYPLRTWLRSKKGSGKISSIV